MIKPDATESRGRMMERLWVLIQTKWRLNDHLDSQAIEPVVRRAGSHAHRQKR